MTWHHYHSKIPLHCGSASCTRLIVRRKPEDPPAIFARVTAAKLVRCRECAERMRDDGEEARGVCAWPRLVQSNQKREGINPFLARGERDVQRRSVGYGSKHHARPNGTR